MDVQMVDEIVPTRYSIVQSGGGRAPVLIFHHGSGDQPYHTRIRKIMQHAATDSPLSEATIIATDSPYNRSRKEYFDAIGELRKFATIFAVSTALIEALVLRAHDADPSGIVVSGISLGGWVANLHHAFFNSADEYRPIFAGAAPDALFLDSAYSRLTSKRAHENRDRICAVLNFEEAFTAVPGDNVFPLLGRFDQYVVSSRQGVVYPEDHITTMERGHITGSSSNREIADHLGEGLKQCAFQSPATLEST